MWLTHDCGRSRTHDACTAVLKKFGTFEFISTLPENTRPPSTSLYTEQSGLVCTLYELTHCEASMRPCVTTPVTVCTEPSEIVMYWPTQLVDADHPCAESSIDRACPLPGDSLFQTLEYDRALSTGFTTSTSAPKKAGAHK